MLRNWNELEIPLKIADLNGIVLSKEHPGYYLKKFRIINDLKTRTIAKAINVSTSNLRTSQTQTKYFSKEISIKLARYFDLDTKYFYDNYLEDTNDIDIKIKSYMKKNNLTLKQLSNKLNLKIKTLKSWINGERLPSRKTYKKLKKLHII